LEIWIWIEYVNYKSHQQKKNIQVFQHKPGILKGWKLVFTEAMRFLEPGFASVIRGNENEEVHGVLALISKETAESLDQQERTYVIEKLPIEAYDGEVIISEVYTKVAPVNFGIPSRRYLALLIKGAEENKLKEDYLQFLKKNHPVYFPTEETLEKRKLLPKFSDENVRKFHITDLNENLCSAHGFVFECKPHLKAWWGRDVTMRNLLHFRGLSVDKHDDGGKTFPTVSQVTEEEREYLWSNVDFLISKGPVVGLLKEFWEFQLSEKKK